VQGAAVTRERCGYPDEDEDMSTGTFLGYRNAAGEEMHCAHPKCISQEMCVKGCVCPTPKKETEDEDMTDDTAHNLTVVREALEAEGLTVHVKLIDAAIEDVATLRAQLATSQEMCTKFEAAVGEDVGEILKLRDQLEALTLTS
jgi:hypothetical protein